MSHRAGPVSNPGPEHLDKDTEMLTRAFDGDPLMEHLFPGNSVESRRALMRLACHMRLELSWPLKGCWDDKRICGATGISIERDPPWPNQLAGHYENLKNQIGPDGTDRLENYSKIVEHHRPHEPNIYIGVIGVEPEKQELGFGRALLETVHQFSYDHPMSTGYTSIMKTPGTSTFMSIWVIE